MLKKLGKIIFISVVSISGFSINSQACTRVICEGADRYITTRSLDWEENIPSALWIFPKGLKRNGGGDNPLFWTSKYGSVITSGYDSFTGDGMNEKGLVANMLWLSESDYRKSNNPTLSIGALAQYVLDNYSNVKQAVQGLKSLKFQIITTKLPGDSEDANMHLVISDSSGDSAIFEFIKGKMKVHHSKKYKVATNSPTYNKQLAIDSYWKGVGGKAMLPGTHRPADRFVKASFYTNNITKGKMYDDKKMAISRAFSIIRDASVPIGIDIPHEKKDLPSTIWRSISDQKELRYYLDVVVSPSVFWVDIKKLNLSKKGEVKKLDLSNYPNYSGEVSDMFIKAKPFKWLD